MNDLLASPYFKDFAIPLLSVILTVILKMSSRKDTNFGFSRDDFAIGFDLSVTALVLAVAKISDIALKSKTITLTDNEKHTLENLPWFILALCFSMYCLAMIIRKVGWNTSTPPVQKKWSVFLLFISGVGVLYLTITLIK